MFQWRSVSENRWKRNAKPKETGALSTVAPIAAAAMLLHGKIAWGEGWYEQACYLLYGDLPESLRTTAQPAPMVNH